MSQFKVSYTTIKEGNDRKIQKWVFLIQRLGHKLKYKVSYNIAKKDDENYIQQLIHMSDLRREFVPHTAI